MREEFFSIDSIFISLLPISFFLSFNRIGKGVGVSANFNLQKRNLKKLHQHVIACAVYYPYIIRTSIYLSTSVSDKTPETTLIYAALSAINNLRRLRCRHYRFGNKRSQH